MTVRPPDSLPPPRALCLDLDETLLNNDGVHNDAIALTSQAIAGSQPGMSGTRLIGTYHTVVTNYGAEVESKWDGGDLDAASFTLEAWRRALSACGCTDEAVAQRAAAMHYRLAEAGYRLFEDAREFFEAAREAGLPLALITNGPTDLQRSKLRALGISDWFEAVAISGEVGVAKPDPGIFEHVLRGMGVPNDGVWHVGDNPATDVAGAQAAGLTGVWLNRTGAVRREADPEPDLEITSLSELLPFLAGSGGVKPG
ncbi:MAG: HAD family hydrolase [Dehalococcoidia bacterium]|nr:HAD family hydrolase [Dehalococcoidia bacterium]